jgi:hypothetical protein
MDERSDHSTARGMLDTAIRVAFPILLGIAGWTYTTITDHEARLHFIEQTRYTAADRDRDSGKLGDQLQKVEISQARTSEKLDALNESVKKLEAALTGVRR